MIHQSFIINTKNGLTIGNLAILSAWGDVYNLAIIRQNEEEINVLTSDLNPSVMCTSKSKNN